jgi:hypothetical protein
VSTRLPIFTTANANVFYELGVHHAVLPCSTVLLFAEGGRLPFDVTPLRAMPYRLTPEGKPADLASTRVAIVARLLEAQNGSPDSPIFQLVEGFPEIDHTKTDVFRDRVRYSAARTASAPCLRAMASFSFMSREPPRNPLRVMFSAVGAG